MKNNIPIGIFRIRVFGEPRPTPKKEVSRTGIPYVSDYRTRKNPITGKSEKYDRGYKTAWLKQVRKQVWDLMQERGLQPYPKNHPIAIGLLFFITKAKSCTLKFPSQDPDLDNLEYGIMNCLKRTIKGSEKTLLGGYYPGGVLFYEDNQSVWRIGPSGKIWAKDSNQEANPGVLITVCSMEEKHMGKDSYLAHSDRFLTTNGEV